jgi:hypothetical protein
VFQRAIELGDGYIGAGSTSIDAPLEDIKKLPPNFPKAKRLYVELGDQLPRLRDWFKAFYGKPEMAEQVAVWGSSERIAEQITRLKQAGVNEVLLNPVFDDQGQMEKLCEDVLRRVH